MGSPCRCMQKCTAGWHAAPGTALGPRPLAPAPGLGALPAFGDGICSRVCYGEHKNHRTIKVRKKNLSDPQVQPHHAHCPHLQCLISMVLPVLPHLPSQLCHRALWLYHAGSALSGISIISVARPGKVARDGQGTELLPLASLTVARAYRGRWQISAPATGGDPGQPPADLCTSQHGQHSFLRSHTEPPATPLRTKALLSCTWARKDWAQPTALLTAALQHHPRRQLAAAAHCLTEHRFPCPQHQPRGVPRTHPPLGEEGLAAHPTLRLLLKTHREATLRATAAGMGAAGRRTGFLRLLPSCCSGRVPFPGRTHTLEAMLFLSRSRLGWEGTAALLPPGSPQDLNKMRYEIY